MLLEKRKSGTMAPKGTQGSLKSGDWPEEEREGDSFHILENGSNFPLIVYAEDERLTLDKRIAFLGQREPQVGGKAVKEDIGALEERKGDNGVRVELGICKGKDLLVDMGEHAEGLA